MSKSDYLMEKRLKELNPELHKRFTDAVFGLQNILTNYRNLFPWYTDHSALHSMTVLNYGNQILGVDSISKLNADEIYIFIMACYFHDTGMGISKKDFEEFSEKIDFGDYFETHAKDDYVNIVRSFHHEFSGEFIKKYSSVFDFPSPEHEFAVVNVARGHRKTDLFNEVEYPKSLALYNGNTINMPYLAAVLRLADEMDVAEDRNIGMTDAFKQSGGDFQIMEYAKHDAIQKVSVTHDAFIFDVDTVDEKVRQGITELAEKIQDTLDYCVLTVEKQTPYEITQRKIILNWM